MKILITGNPVDGFEFFGPYEPGHDWSVDPATDGEADWWVADLQPALTDSEGRRT